MKDYTLKDLEKVAKKRNENLRIKRRPRSKGFVTKHGLNQKVNLLND